MHGLILHELRQHFFNHRVCGCGNKLLVEVHNIPQCIHCFEWVCMIFVGTGHTTEKEGNVAAGENSIDLDEVCHVCNENHHASAASHVVLQPLQVWLQVLLDEHAVALACCCQKLPHASAHQLLRLVKASHGPVAAVKQAMEIF